MNIILTSAIAGIILMFSGFYVKDKKQLPKLAIVLFVGMILSALLELQGCSILLGKYPNMIRENTTYGVIFFIVLCLSAIYYLALNSKSFEKVGPHVAEYLALICFSFTGIAVLGVFNNMVVMFLGIEILSIPMYILAGSAKDKLKSTEAAIKYFLMGAFSTGIMLLGLAFLYGGTGTFILADLGVYIAELQTIYFLGWLLIIFSMCFKIAAVPFHFWVPDVYEGTPTVFTSYMAAIVKGGALLAFITLVSSFPFQDAYAEYYKLIISFIIFLTLIVGNISAVTQKSVKRMMAYSSIAQAGFMLFVLYQPQSAASKEALLYYIFSYSIANFIVFYTLTRLKKPTYKSFNGLSKTHPLLAFTTAVALISMAGIPLTSGFIAKFMVLSIGAADPNNFILIVFALVMAVLSVYYYFRVIVAMYFKKPKSNKKQIKISLVINTLLVVGVILIVILGVFPDLFFRLVKSPMW